MSPNSPSSLKMKSNSSSNLLIAFCTIAKMLIWWCSMLKVAASTQVKPTQATMQNVKQFLDYMAMHLNAIIYYYPSDMELNSHSDHYINLPLLHTAEPQDIISLDPSWLMAPPSGSISPSSPQICCCCHCRSRIGHLLLGIPGHQPHFMLATPWWWTSSTIPSSDNSHGQWKCIISGFLLVEPKNSSNSGKKSFSTIVA